MAVAGFSEPVNLTGVIIQAFLHGGNNCAITRAATKIAGQPAANLCAADFLIPVFFDKGGGGHNEARRTDAALHSAFIYKGLLDFGQPGVAAFAFHRANGASVGPNRQINAGINGQAIDQYGTRAAFTHGASLFDTGQAQLLPQHFQQ